MNEEIKEKDDLYINKDAPPLEPDDEFDFVGAYDDTDDSIDEQALPENSAESAINCAFIGVGGGGGKLGSPGRLLARKDIPDPGHWRARHRRIPGRPGGHPGGCG